MSNIVDLTSQRKIPPRPWYVEGFQETSEGEHCGWMIIAADGETIVAQMMSIQVAELICQIANKEVV